VRLMVAWTIGAILAIASYGASAHSLSLFVREEGGVVKGSAYFAGGEPVKNVTVQILDPSDKTLGEVKTDAEGNFEYTGARSGGELHFVVSTADGHRAESKLEMGSVAAPAGSTQAEGTALPEVSSAPTHASAVERQLGAIQVALDRLEHRLWMRDVVGGIGYIFGLAGLWALWKSRSGGARD